MTKEQSDWHLKLIHYSVNVLIYITVIVLVMCLYLDLPMFNFWMNLVVTTLSIIALFITEKKNVDEPIGRERITIIHYINKDKIK